MANSKVSALTAKATPVTADTIYLVDSSDGSSKKCTLLQMFAAATPTLTTPVLGVATATSINKVAITAPASSATLTISDGKTLAATQSITLTGTDSTVMTFPTTSATIARTDAGNTFTGVSTGTSWVLTTPTITTKLNPTTDDGAPLGDTTHNWSDLFLATGAVLNYANGNVVVTHSSGILTMGTGEMRITTVGTNTASVVTVGGTQTLTNKTLTTPVIATAGYIADTNGNEALVFTTTSSAVNEITLVNAAAGSNATILASGTGTSPGINMTGKAGASATNPGGTIVVAGGAGNTTGAGGLVSLTGGAGGNDAVGGSASLVGGAAGGGNRAGGAALVTGGAGAGTAAGGAVTLTSGAAANGSGVNPGASGAITLQAGAAGTATTGTAGAGGTISLLGVAGGASTGASSTAGAGSGIVITAGAGGASSGGSDTAGAGGDVIVTPGAAGAGTTAGKPGAVILRGSAMPFIKTQGSPTAKTVSATLTAAEILAGIITVNQQAGGTSALQLCTGTALTAAVSANMATGDAFDVSVINISTVTAEDASITTNTGMTLVGNMDFSSNDAATSRSSGILRFRKTGATTFTVYRLA